MTAAMLRLALSADQLDGGTRFDDELVEHDKHVAAVAVADATKNMQRTLPAAMEEQLQAERARIAAAIQERLDRYASLGEAAVANRFTVLAAFDTSAEIARIGAAS